MLASNQECLNEISHEVKSIHYRLNNQFLSNEIKSKLCARLATLYHEAHVMSERTYAVPVVAVPAP